MSGQSGADAYALKLEDDPDAVGAFVESRRHKRCVRWIGIKGFLEFVNGLMIAGWFDDFGDLSESVAENIGYDNDLVIFHPAANQRSR